MVCWFIRICFYNTDSTAGYSSKPVNINALFHIILIVFQLLQYLTNKLLNDDMVKLSVNAHLLELCIFFNLSDRHAAVFYFSY